MVLAKSFLTTPRRLIKDQVFTLVELLLVIAIIATFAALLLPALGRTREKLRQVVCLNNCREMGVAFNLLFDDQNNRFPKRRDLKLFLGLGYQPWITWLKSNPRGGWAPLVLSNELVADKIWMYPAWEESALHIAPQTFQLARINGSASKVTYWLWRFDGPDDPIPPDDFRGKAVTQCVEDLRLANNPQAGHQTAIVSSIEHPPINVSGS